MHLAMNAVSGCSGSLSEVSVAWSAVANAVPSEAPDMLNVAAGTDGKKLRSVDTKMAMSFSATLVTLVR